MRQLSKTQSWIYLIGGVLMTVGAGCCAILWHPEWMCWMYILGSLMFVAMQAQQRYDGQNTTIRRLRKIMLISGGLFILAGVSMADTAYLFLRRFFSTVTYIQFFYHKWVMLLLAAAILQLYTTHRISNELEKES